MVAILDSESGFGPVPFVGSIGAVKSAPPDFVVGGRGEGERMAGGPLLASAERERA